MPLDRDDLMIVEWGDFNYGAGAVERSYRVAQDADLRALGYVKLDGVNTKVLRKALFNADPGIDSQLVVIEVARKYLAALEGETP